MKWHLEIKNELLNLHALISNLSLDIRKQAMLKIL